MQDVTSPVSRPLVQWSEAILEKLGRDYERALHDASGLRASLLNAQLKVTSGKFAEADAIVNDFISSHAGDIYTNEAGIGDELMWTTFILQRFDILTSLLQKEAPLIEHIEIAMGKGRTEFWVIEMVVLEPHSIRIIFDETVFQTDHTNLLFRRFVGLFPLFVYYVKHHAIELGSAIISLGDDDLPGSLGFSTCRAESFLIPDYYFFVDRGYDTMRKFFSQNPIPWDARNPVALWRGSTTGDPDLPSERWRELPRIRLCELARSATGEKLIDAFITDITQISSSVAIEEITSSGYVGGYMPPQDFPKWKFQIDIDGNTNSWPGLFLKLLTGSVVLKVASPRGHRQWYYDKLKPWINYVPVSADLSDLMERLEWLRAHDDVAREIGQQGKLLANSLDYPSELESAANVITAAIRCFNAGCRPSGCDTLTSKEVELAYRLMLGRTPESQDVIYKQIASVQNLEQLRQAFLKSDEFKEKVFAFYK